MGQCNGARCGFVAASWILAFAWLLASCAPRVEGPAPVTSGEVAEQHPESVRVQRGQTLSGIARAYHVPMRAIAAANYLSPPYRIEAGRTLIIPGVGQPAVQPTPMSVASLPSGTPEDRALSASRPEPVAEPKRPEMASIDNPTSAPPEKSAIDAAPLPAPVAPTPPPPAEPAAPNAKSSPVPLAPGSASTPPPLTVAPAPPAPSSTPAAPAPNSGAFLWPVRGHVLLSYGSGTDGTHNDGINIGAPRGAAVQAADAGVVAYTGNELRGYGNLILVKHASGWISAYAHCDAMLVKRGEKVARGQTIARVGSTGNVREPQLHFELRRGNHAVDPQEFLAPLPAAAVNGSRSG